MGELRVSTSPETSVLVDREARLVPSSDRDRGVGTDALYVTYDEEGDLHLWRTGVTQRAN